MPEENIGDQTSMPRYEEYVATITALWDAFNRGDFDVALAGVHPDIDILSGQHAARVVAGAAVQLSAFLAGRESSRRHHRSNERGAGVRV